MNMDAVAIDDVVAADCRNLRQGDIVDLRRISMPADNSTGSEWLDTPLGVAVISQTCDATQPGRRRCLVAPILGGDPVLLTDTVKGRRPLLVPVGGAGPGSALVVADMEQVVSIPKALLTGKRMIGRSVAETSSQDATRLADRIGRAVTRFAFPDDVHRALQSFRQKAQHKAGTESNFGRVLDRIRDLRVSSDQWSSGGRNMLLWAVVDEEYKPARDDFLTEIWDSDHIEGLSGQDSRTRVGLDRVCQLILTSLDAGKPAAPALWTRFEELVEDTLLRPNLNDGVASFEVQVVSDVDMTYRQYQQTVSLDLEVLSDLHGPKETGTS